MITINVGAAPNDGLGDPLRDAFISTNTNFTEVVTDYAFLKNPGINVVPWTFPTGYPATQNALMVGTALGSPLAWSGGSTTSFGFKAGENLANGASHNCLIGAAVGLQLTTGGKNTGVGNNALGSHTYIPAHPPLTGDDNTAVGYYSMAYLEDTGADNTAVGAYALQDIITGSRNVSVGTSAGSSATLTNNNICIGYRAGDVNLTGDDNIIIDTDGVGSSIQAGGTGRVMIGSEMTVDNNDEQINIGNSNISTGTSCITIGRGNECTGSGAYNVIIGTLNLCNGSTSSAIGYNNNITGGDQWAYGEQNTLTRSWGVGSGGMKSMVIGEANEVDCSKAIVIGFQNDIAGSFGSGSGSGNETIVIGSRMNGTLLGPMRTVSTGPRVILATGEYLGVAEDKQNSVEYYTPTATTSGVYHPALYNSASYANDAAASAAGVGLGELYRNGSVVQIRMV